MERKDPEPPSTASSKGSKKSKRSRSSKRSNTDSPYAEASVQNTATAQPTSEMGQPDLDRTAGSAVQERTKTKKSRRSRKGISEVTGIAKTADQNRPESERSVTSTVLEGSDVKKGRRAKKRRSIPSDSLEAPKREAIQQQSSTSLESGTSAVVPAQTEPTPAKDEAEADKMATKADSLVLLPEAAVVPASVPAPEAGAEPPRPYAVMPVVQYREEQGQPALRARQTEPELINQLRQPQEEKNRAELYLRSSGIRDDRKTSNTTINRRRLFDAAVLSVFAVNVVAVVWLLIRAWDGEDIYVKVPGLGTFRGLRVTVEGKPVYMFRGIQFARSPEGLLRFAPASTVSVRNSTDVDARVPKSGCVQKPYEAHGQVIRSNEGTIEDCLHLNVWTPCTESIMPGCRKTVLVFFHAIEFQNGDNNYYDGRWLAGLGQLVVVAPNFRLGAFGFLNIGCLLGDMQCTSADVALGDQRMAVQWVVDHISSFGGNASDVVLMGSASGAWSVGAHLLTDGMDGPRFWSHERFAKVILMSESPFRRYFDDKSHEMPSLLGCSRGGTVEMLHCMRTVPPREIVRVTSEVVHYFGPSASAHPRIEDARRVTGRRFLLGTVSNEGTHLFDYLRRTSRPEADMGYVLATFLKLIYHINNGGEIIDAFRKTIAPVGNAAANGDSWAYELLGDLFYKCPLLRLGHELSTKGRNVVYGYVFDHRASFALFNDTTGSARFMDLDFVFGRPLDGSRTANDQEQDLSRRMIEMWSAFAKTGNLPFVDGQPWPAYTDDGKDIQVRISLTQLEEVRDYRKQSCAVLPSFVDHTMSTGVPTVNATGGHSSRTSRKFFSV